MQNITVIGAGAWGTALAEIFSRAGKTVTLLARDAALAGAVNTEHENALYLPGFRLDDKLRATVDSKQALTSAGLVVLATPAQYLRDTLKNIAPLLPQGVPLINSAKGIEIATGSLMSEVVEAAAPGHPYGVLSGPTFATEAVRGLPTAITLAAATESCAREWAAALRGAAFRPYSSDDIIGVEIGGALKNVIAIACGFVEGKKLGQNAKAAVMTRGIAEIKRYGLGRGAKPETFLGLAGLGDLSLTCSSMTSRNFSLGFEMGQGRRLEDVMAARHSVAEGVSTASAIAAEAARRGIDMPICLAVKSILQDGARLDDVIAQLLSRDLKHENA